jgi:aminoglycoside-2''-adenylyltransferase
VVDPSFTPDLDAWEPWRPDVVAAALASMPVPWAVAGGWAIDLHVQAETRPHDDIEIAVCRDHMEVVAACLGELDWFGVGDGRAWPLADAPEDLHQTWGRDRYRHRWRLDVFREPWDGQDWVFRRDPRVRRPLAEAIEFSPETIPYLAPEIVLLFKAKALTEKDEADLAVTLPMLTRHQIEWLRTALEIVHPKHQWTARLGTIL